MISLKKYLDNTEGEAEETLPSASDNILKAVLAGYRSALHEMGRCGENVCPALANPLRRELDNIAERLVKGISAQSAAEAEGIVGAKLRDWGLSTAQHYHAKAHEVKDLLLVLARTAQSVGERDHVCAEQMNKVTEDLKEIASLEDVSQIRASIEESALVLKASIDRMTSAGNTAIEELRAEVSTYRTRLEEAEYIAACDSLTGLGSRLWTEGQIEKRIEAGTLFCAIAIDIDGFKHVNDVHGHLVGDELLKQFAAEIRSASRTNDIIGRWGGDEFLVLMDCSLKDAEVRMLRLHEWICGDYEVRGRSGKQKIRVNGSFGIAEYSPGETLAIFLDRADAGMYSHKAATRNFGAPSQS